MTKYGIKSKNLSQDFDEVESLIKYQTGNYVPLRGSTKNPLCNFTTYVEFQFIPCLLLALHIKKLVQQTVTTSQAFTKLTNLD